METAPGARSHLNAAVHQYGVPFPLLRDVAEVTSSAGVHFRSCFIIAGEYNHVVAPGFVSEEKDEK